MAKSSGLVDLSLEELRLVGELWLRNEAWRVVLDPGQRAWQTRWDSHDGDAVNGSGRQRGKSFAAFAMQTIFP